MCKYTHDIRDDEGMREKNVQIYPYLEGVEGMREENV